MVASRWHSPPKPALVLTSETGTPSPPSSSASMLVAMSPSRIPSRTRSPSAVMVAFRSVVLPAPGEDIRLTVVTPARAKSARLRSATRSFSSRMLSSTATRSAPVST